MPSALLGNTVSGAAVGAGYGASFVELDRRDTAAPESSIVIAAVYFSARKILEQSSTLPQSILAPTGSSFQCHDGIKVPHTLLQICTYIHIHMYIHIYTSFYLIIHKHV